jgi:alkanesulfonate monooxygenase SsuD/methylene tetrahydromethanopterin reductase-like flavin-dependent oxidoreductase (luciferase family)
MLGVAFRDTGLHISDLVALARAADDAGYSSIWAPEVGSRDAIVLCSLYGQVTKRASIGTGVVPLYSRNVVTLALACAAAAEASDGRFILGMGAGHRFTAEAWYEGHWDKPRTRMRETVDVLKRILGGERVTNNGLLHVNGFHLGATPPVVPVYLAALTPPSLRLAGEVADGVILNWLPPEGIEKAALLAREAAADAGRRIRVIAYVRTAVVDVRTAVVDDAKDEHDARVALREQTYAYLTLPTYANSLRQVGYAKDLDDMAAGKERAVDDLVDVLCAGGDASTVRKRLKDYRDAGVDSVIVYPVPFGEDPASSILHTIRAAV